MSPARILLQTTITPTADDWGIHRFAMLAEHLAGLTDAAGRRSFKVTARDRGPTDAPDPVLSKLSRMDFDAVWLFAVDVGDGLTAEDRAGIGRFRRAGGGLLATRDHMDVGCSLCTLPGVGAAHHFHTRNVDADPRHRRVDDTETTHISWPNYHSGANGDFQHIEPVGPLHPVLLDREAADGRIGLLPAHPHEGAVAAPSDDPAARVIATSRSLISGARFNTAVAFEATAALGPAIAQSTFHHFADYNWDPATGCPSFVTEMPGHGIARSPEAQRQIRLYATNVAHWLAGRAVL